MRTLLPRLVLFAVALAVVPAQAQIAFRAAASATAAGVTPAFRAAASATTTGATLTITKPSGTATDDVLIASIAVTPSSVTITPPSGWTLVRRMDNAGPTSNSLAVYWKAAVAGEPASYAWGVSGASFAVGGVQAFSGIDSANPIDVENGQNTPSATAHAAPAVTSSVANAMLVASHAFASSRTWTPPSGMTESFDRPSGANSATGLSVEGSRVLVATAGSSGTKTATAAGNADAGNAHLLALRPASANLAISTPSGTTAGDVMIAAIGFSNAGAAITAPSGWTLVRRMNNTGTTSNALAVYRKSAASGEPSSHVWGVAGGAFLVGGIQSFSGVDGTNPIDAESGQSTASGTNHDTPSITTSTANTMLVTSHTYASAQSWTPQAGLTESFERLSGSASATGQSITGTRQAQAAAGASGTKRSTAASSADVGNTHILALRQLQPQVQALHFIHVDHLNTPRLVSNAAGTTVWRWDQQEPFGVNVPDENPSGLGVFDLPLRLPGQYFDKETNLHYNYFRDYDPGIGRYAESDPIGLAGGLNTYGYAGSAPLTNIDPTGEFFFVIPLAAYLAAGGTLVNSGAVVAAIGIVAIAATAGSSDTTMKDCRATCDSPGFNEFIKCKDLPPEYFYTSKHGATVSLRQAVGETIRVSPKGPQGDPADKGPCGPNSGHVRGQHWTAKYVSNGERAGAIVSCQCCDDSSGAPRIKDKFRVIP